MKKSTSVISLTATLFFLIVLIVLHGLSSEINPIHYGISYYAFGDYSYLLCIALISVGIGGIALGITMWSSDLSTMRRIGIVLLMIWGLLSILAGLFPLDPLHSPITLSGAIHNIAGRNVILIIPGVFLIELAKAGTDAADHKRRVSLLSAWFLLVSTILMFIYNAPYAYLGWGGGFQRLYWLALTLWLFINAFQQLRRSAFHENHGRLTNEGLDRG
jgi:hypothetical protein